MKKFVQIRFKVNDAKQLREWLTSHGIKHTPFNAVRSVRDQITSEIHIIYDVGIAASHPMTSFLLLSSSQVDITS